MTAVCNKDQLKDHKILKYNPQMSGDMDPNAVEGTYV